MAEQTEGTSQETEPQDSSEGTDDAVERAPSGSTELASGAIRDALGGLMSVLMQRGRVELGRAASTGRTRLDLRMLRRDQDRMYQKLGREVRALVEGGEVSHPGLVRGVERIVEHEAKMAEVEARLAAEDAAAQAEENPSES